VLTQPAVDFIEALHRRFSPVREDLLRRRVAAQARIDAGDSLDFSAATAAVRGGEWTVAAAPADLANRRVEITGPTDAKMIINALNSGATGYMADFEDSNAPTWENMVEGQANLRKAVRRTLTFSKPDGREYRLNDTVATLLVRPRGWHLVEKHLLVDGVPISASLFDFGLFTFHNAQALQEIGSNPYFYLPKLQNHLEAQLWNEVFDFTEETLDLAPGSLRATVLIETFPAAFEMEEILYELRTHSAGLNAGRWDYLFSVVKTFAARSGAVLPDRRRLTMTVPFMRAYTELVVRTCHKHGAHAIGGMAAFIPSRRDPAVNQTALAAVHADKQREATDGFDGTWVAHPDLVPIAFEEFDRVLGSRPNQLDRTRDDVHVTAAQLLDLDSAGHEVTAEGVRNNISVGLRYLTAWLGGSGAVAIYNLMEDVATAEIVRSQLWQWLHRRVVLTDGETVRRELLTAVEDEEMERIRSEIGTDTRQLTELEAARSLLDELIDSERVPEFLTVRACELLP
jgi:malate synthase